jgi:hypothetical protein
MYDANINVALFPFPLVSKTCDDLKGTLRPSSENSFCGVQSNSDRKEAH